MTEWACPKDNLHILKRLTQEGRLALEISKQVLGDVTMLPVSVKRLWSNGPH